MRKLLLTLFLLSSACLNAQTFSDFGNYQVNSRKEIVEMRPIDRQASIYWNTVFHMVTYQASNVELSYIFEPNEQVQVETDSILYTIHPKEYKIYNKADSTFVMVTLPREDLELMMQHLRLELSLIKHKNNQRR